MGTPHGTSRLGSLTAMARYVAVLCCGNVLRRCTVVKRVSFDQSKALILLCDHTRLLIALDRENAWNWERFEKLPNILYCTVLHLFVPLGLQEQDTLYFYVFLPMIFTRNHFDARR